MVVVRIPDGERRPVGDLVKLPEAEQDAIFGSGPPTSPGGTPHIAQGMFGEITVKA